MGFWQPNHPNLGRFEAVYPNLSAAGRVAAPHPNLGRLHPNLARLRAASAPAERRLVGHIGPGRLRHGRRGQPLSLPPVRPVHPRETPLRPAGPLLRPPPWRPPPPPPPPEGGRPARGPPRQPFPP